MDQMNRSRASTTTCFSCGGSLKEALGELRFEDGDVTVIVTDVPMYICETCGERHVPGPLGVELSELADAAMSQLDATLRARTVVVHSKTLVLHASDRAKLALAS